VHGLVVQPGNCYDTHTHTHSLKCEHTVVDVWTRVCVIANLAVAQLPDLNILADKVQHVWNFKPRACVSFYTLAFKSIVSF